MQLEKAFRTACESGLRRGILVAACAAAASAAYALEVADVTARQRWPWNNLVDVTFQLSGVESSETFYRIDVSASYPGMAGDAVAAKSLVSEPLVKGNGSHAVVWDMGADLHGRREIPVVHKGRAHRKSLRGRETLHLVHHFVQHFPPDFALPFDFHETE